MSDRLKGVPEVIKTNPESERAAQQANADWQAVHGGAAVVEPIFDARGRQTNYADRLEVSKSEGDGFTIVVTSDGTVRKDLIDPTPIAAPAKSAGDGQYRYTAEDLLALGQNTSSYQTSQPVEKEKAPR